MGSHRISRRSFGTGFVLGVPAVMAGHTRAAAYQTPAATPATPAGGELGFAAQVTALEPEDLLSRLLSEPFDPAWVVIPTEFAPEAVPDEDMPEDEFSAAVLGAVQVISSDAVTDTNNRVLGGYLVFGSMEDATRTMEALPRLLVQGNEHEGDTFVLPLSIAGLSGVTGVSDDYAQSSLQVGYVIIISNDIFLADGARTNPEAAVIRSSYYLTGMLDHLNRVTREPASD